MKKTAVEKSGISPRPIRLSRRRGQPDGRTEAMRMAGEVGPSRRERANEGQPALEIRRRRIALPPTRSGNQPPREHRAYGMADGCRRVTMNAGTNESSSPSGRAPSAARRDGPPRPVRAMEVHASRKSDHIRAQRNHRGGIHARRTELRDGRGACSPRRRRELGELTDELFVVSEYLGRRPQRTSGCSTIASSAGRSNN